MSTFNNTLFHPEQVKVKLSNSDLLEAFYPHTLISKLKGYGYFSNNGAYYNMRRTLDCVWFTGHVSEVAPSRLLHPQLVIRKSNSQNVVYKGQIILKKL